MLTKTGRVYTTVARKLFYFESGPNDLLRPREELESAAILFEGALPKKNNLYFSLAVTSKKNCFSSPPTMPPPLKH